jgi:hypothetical protein
VVQKRHELACLRHQRCEVYGDMRAPETEKTEALLLSLDYVPISWEASKLAGERRQEWAAFLLPALPP